MAKELMEIGGFITEGAEIVNHNNTLSGNGTVDSPLGVVPGYNETVLWIGNATTATQTLSENISSFEEVKVYGETHNHYPWISNAWITSSTVYGVGIQMWWNNPAELDVSRYCLSGNKIVPMKGSWYTFPTSATTGTVTGNAAKESYICKVIGINRKA